MVFYLHSSFSIHIAIKIMLSFIYLVDFIKYRNKHHFYIYVHETDNDYYKSSIN
ncbi:hypothetical protein ymoll0001_7220 [Yersinia mollaretii ATCC 43969]|uniref:Uncharacterized protein n=1 Tax=Yersinia mollaretii (strain ATCC 43969 / DSM 18520 / CIP 103324 / CNY 7263 / WAIP 204) TaxID=349967 RepID=A0ABP2EHI6_YERMW|nr:hypothetical protein ymoll0001_7220 [Yersinia mollaretii ATCC 43969]